MFGHATHTAGVQTPVFLSSASWKFFHLLRHCMLAEELGVNRCAVKEGLQRKVHVCHLFAFFCFYDCCQVSPLLGAILCHKPSKHLVLLQQQLQCRQVPFIHSVQGIVGGFGFMIPIRSAWTIPRLHMLACEAESYLCSPNRPSDWHPRSLRASTLLPNRLHQLDEPERLFAQHTVPW